MISRRKSEQVSKVTCKEMNLPEAVASGTERVSAPDVSAMHVREEEKTAANPQLKATVSPAEKLKRFPDLSPRVKQGLIPALAESPKAVSTLLKQFRTSGCSKKAEETVCIACGDPNFEECNCFRKPEKKREIDGKVEELFAAQKKKMSVPEYREYERQRKCYMQKHKVPYSEMIMGHGYDDYKWPKVCQIYYENSVRIQNALAAMGKEISLYSIVPNGKDNDKIRAMFNNHQTIADAISGDRKEKGPGYDHYSWEQVCRIYHDNSLRIQHGLKPMGKEISLSSMDPKSADNDMIRLMFNNHQTIADALADRSRGPLYDDCSLQQKCDIYNENSMSIEEVMSKQAMRKEISLYSIVPEKENNDRIRSMFNNHLTIADALAGTCRDKGPGYDLYTWDQVCYIYNENLERIQDSLGTLGIKISLSSMRSNSEEDDKIRTMFKNHRTLAQVLGPSKRDKRAIPAFIAANFGKVFLAQTIAGYLLGKALDGTVDLIKRALTAEADPTLSDYTRILAQPEFFGILQQWLYNCINAPERTAFENISEPTKMIIEFHDGRQVITIPNFVNDNAVKNCFDYYMKKFAKPYYEKKEIVHIDTCRTRKFAAMLFHNGKIIFRNAEDNRQDYAKLITENYLNKKWEEDL